MCLDIWPENVQGSAKMFVRRASPLEMLGTSVFHPVSGPARLWDPSAFPVPAPAYNQK